MRIRLRTGTCFGASTPTSSTWYSLPVFISFTTSPACSCPSTTRKYTITPCAQAGTILVAPFLCRECGSSRSKMCSCIYPRRRQAPHDNLLPGLADDTRVQAALTELLDSNTGQEQHTQGIDLHRKWRGLQVCRCMKSPYQVGSHTGHALHCRGGVAGSAAHTVPHHFLYLSLARERPGTTPTPGAPLPHLLIFSFCMSQHQSASTTHNHKHTLYGS